MTGYSVSIDVAAPPERVWHVMSDVDRWPEWTPGVSRVTRLAGKPFAVGTRVVVKQPKFPTAIWKVTDLQPSRSFTWISQAPGLRVVGIHSIEPTSSGSHVTLTLQVSGMFSGWFWRLTRKRSEEYIHYEANGLKARSEGGERTP